MENKNEKTFADLFSNSNLSDDVDEQIKEENATFDSLINGIFDKDTNSSSISFGDINGILEENEEQFEDNGVDKQDATIYNNSVLESTNSEKDESLDVGETLSNSSDLFFNTNQEDSNEQLEDVKAEDNNLFFNDILSNELKEAVNEVINPVVDEKKGQEESFIFENKEQDANLFFGASDENRAELSKDNVTLNKDDVTELGKDNKIEENNLFFDNVSEEKDERDISFNQDKTDSSDNIFFENKEDNNLKSDLSSEAGNVFFDNSLDEKSDINVQDNGGVESINELVEKNNALKEEKDTKIGVVSTSPFFQESSSELDKIEESILGDNRISFDQTKQINSNVNRLDLSETKNFNVKLVKKKVPFIKFVFGVISYAFFIFLVLILVTLLAYVLDIKVRAAKGDYSAPTYNAYVVLTGSMLPQIQVKDVVVTKKVDTEDLQVGDIITFASSDTRFAGTIITHRIIKKNQDSNGNVTFQTKGDNNNVADSALVQANNIYGKVILKVPKLGYLQDFLATQGGWIICILFPCLGVISYDIVKLAKGIKKKKKKIKVIK